MNRVLAVLACAALLATACQARPSPPSPTASGGLPSADARVYRGDYDGAEAAYLKLASAGDADARAHYALLLDYENRFPEAVAQARAAVEAKASSTTLASLTRALDWSEDVSGAIAAGARAVRATPVDPLARVFYAEALSDGAYFAEARAQLHASEKEAGGGAYLASEVDREWGNYYRAQGDTFEELNHLQLSLHGQPGFPERTLEMARYQYAEAQAPAAAKKLLDGVAASHRGDYAVNLAAADTAFLHGDNQVAESFYQAALKVRPDVASGLLGEAELLVAAKRDFTGAHDLLTRALSANPDSADVANYLRYLDLLVLKTDPAKDLASVSAAASAAQAGARALALQEANRFRSSLGVAALAESAAIDEAALAHAYFWLFNFGQPGVAGLKIHEEDPTLPGAYGADPASRASHFGYTGPRVAEVISHVYIANAAVAHWVDAVFHRYPLADPETVSAGYGEARAGALSIQVMDLGQDAATTHPPVVYPTADQSAVPFAFTGGEIPDPAPGARYPSGYPITVQVGSGSILKISSAELDDPAGRSQAGFGVDSTNSEASPSQWAVLPRDPLTAGGRYTVKLAGTVDGQPFNLSWSFTVAEAP